MRDMLGKDEVSPPSNDANRRQASRRSSITMPAEQLRHGRRSARWRHGPRTMGVSARLRLDLSNKPENVPVLRQALRGFADAISLPSADLIDVTTALTEACNNASQHAYDGAEGPLEVELQASRGWVGLTVRDRGFGLAAAGAGAQAGNKSPYEIDGQVSGIGLPTISGLATRVRFNERVGGGTEVAMWFATPSVRPQGSARTGRGFEGAAVAPAQLANTIELEAAPFAIAKGVLPRLLRATAARAHFAIDRINDVVRVGEMLIAGARSWSSDGRIQAGIVTTPQSLELAVGPMQPDHASTLAAAVRRIEPRDGHQPWPSTSAEERFVVCMRRRP
jgi:serine/threonine-protein kinase RsbW